MKKILNQLYRFLSSYGLAVVLFMLLFVLILFGTLYQIDNGLYAAQKKYFESFFVIHKLGPVSIPLPGGYTVMALLAVNILGGLSRIRRVWSRAGLIISHLGVLVMIASAAVTFHFSDRGHMRLWPNEQSDEYSSYHDWNIEIGKPAAGSTLHVIPDKQFKDLRSGGSREFFATELPLEISVTGYAPNAVPVRTEGSAADAGEDLVDGYHLHVLPEEKEAELNTPGAYVTVKDTATGETTQGILWGLASQPMTVKSGDAHYTIGLERKRYRVPFTVFLDDFKASFHPGTSMASDYEAYITKKENGAEEKLKIFMNHPLRDRGYTFFQTSYGPPNAGPGDALYTVFEVVRNPADQGPLVACIIIGVGLLMHFTVKLFGYMRAESRRRTA